MTVPNTPQIGILAGMTSEGKCLTRTKKNRHGLLAVYYSAGRPHQAAAAARELIQLKVRGIVSFGVAGGLDPSLRPGDLVLPEAILTPDGERLETDAGWRKNLAAVAPSAPLSASSLMISVNEPILGTGDKKRLFEETGAVAVDMESHHAAQAARDARIPFLIIRAIADPAERTIPGLALKGMGKDGRPNALPVIGGLIIEPWNLPGIIRIAIDTKRGLATLRSVADAALPGFGLF